MLLLIVIFDVIIVVVELVVNKELFYLKRVNAAFLLIYSF